MSRERLEKDLKCVFQLWTDKSILNEKLIFGWLATLKTDKFSYLTYRDKLDEASDNPLEAAVAKRFKALNAIESEVLERRCRMNGLPLFGPSSLSMEESTGMTRE